MLDCFQYRLPTRIVFGVHSLENIDHHIRGRKTLVLTSEGAVKRGIIQKITRKTDHIIKTLPSIKAYPEFTTLHSICKQIKEYDFELILAIGGGSVLDSAKFLSVQHKENSYSLASALTRGTKKSKEYSLLPIIALPTTAGTGSELTPWATVWDMEEKRKYSLHLPDLFPETAIYDPALTLTMPRELTIYSALDSLSHALESIWNRNASPITVHWAIEAARLIMTHLPRLHRNLDSLPHRTGLMQATMYAAMAFANTQTALAHGISYYITAHKGVPHGLACSFTLPLLIDTIIGKYDYIDKALAAIFGSCSSAPLRELFTQLGVSTEFADYGLSPSELKELRVSLQNNQRAANSLVQLDP